MRENWLLNFLAIYPLLKILWWPYGAENLKNASPPKFFVQLQPNFMIHTLLIGEYCLLIFDDLPITKIFIALKFFLSIQPCEAGNFKRLVLQFHLISAKVDKYSDNGGTLTIACLGDLPNIKTLWPFEILRWESMENHKKGVKYPKNWCC